MNKMNWKWTLVCAALVAATVLLNAQAWAGKPGGGTPPPPEPLPNVQYNIKWLNVKNAQSVNDSGDVVGDYQGSDGRSRGFLYTPGTGAVDLNTLVDPDDPNRDVRLYPEAINNRGQIVGQGIRNSSSVVFRFTPGFLNDAGHWVPTAVEVIPLPPGIDSATPRDINDDGEVVIYALRLDSNHPNGGFNEAFVYDKSSSWIGPLTKIDGSYLAINNHTQVVGMYSENPILTFRAFRWSLGGGLQLFGQLSGREAREPAWFSNANAINDRGQFAGKALADGYGRAFRYTDGVGMVNLGTLGDRSEGIGINNLGQVVGTYDTFAKVPGWGYRLAHTYGFLYTDASGMVNLDQLVIGTPDDLAKWFSGSIYARKINTPLLPDGTADPNDFGQICGTASFTDAAGNSYSEGFLLTPEPK